MMTMLRRVFHRPGPIPPDPDHEAFVARMEEGRALGIRATRDARATIRRLQRDNPVERVILGNRDDEEGGPPCGS